MARQADIELLIGALGGASPSGATANLIRGQIQSALGKNNPALVKVKLSNQGLRELKAQIESITANIKVAATSSGGSSSTTVKASTQTAMEVAKAKSQQIALDGQQKRDAQELINAERVLREEIKTNTLQRQQQAAVIKAEAAAIRANMSLESARTAQQKKANVETEKRASLQAQCNLEAARFEAYIRTIKPKGIKEFAADIQTVRKQFQNFQLDDARTSVKNLTASFKDAGYEGGNAFTYLHNKIQSFMTYLASSAFTMLFVNAFRNAKQAVIDLNKALVDLRMVTGGSIAQTEQLIKQYNKMAQELGVTTTAITEAAVGWRRQGYSLKEMETLIRNSTILAKVGFLDAAEAQQYLTSMMKGYQISVEDSLSIVDKLAAVDASAAVSAGGLAEAISKTANSARLAGVDLDTLIGYLAAVGEVTQQDMSSLGNAFKTLFARYSNVKLGKLEDDEGESLNDYETVLKTIGISLRNAQGEFRDFGEVFDEVVAKWGDINNVTKSAIAQALGSTRQREGVLTLLENIGNAAKYTEISLGSAGNAVRKFEAYGEGLEAKAATMKAAFEGMANDIIPDEAMGAIYDLGTFVARLLDLFDGLPVRIIAVTAAVVALGKAMNAIRLSSIGTGFKDLARPEMTGRNWNWANHLEEAA